MNTKEVYDKILELSEVIPRKLKLDYGDFQEICIESDGSITIQYKKYLGCGDSDYFYISIEAADIDKENDVIVEKYYQAYIERQNEIKERIKLEEQKRIALLEKEKEERELAEYNRLKKKYEN